MNYQEMCSWLKSAKYVATWFEDHDKCDNDWCDEIYEKDGKFYSVSFCNNHVSEKFGERGYIRGEYEPTEVIKKVETKTIEVVTWEPPEENNVLCKR